MSVWWSNRPDSFYCIPRGTPWMHFMDSMTILLWLLCYMPILLYDFFVVDISVTCKYTSLIMSVWWSNRPDSFHCIPRGTPWMHFMDSMTILLWLLCYMPILLYDYFVVDISVTCKYTSLIMSVWWSNRPDSFHCIPRGTPWMHFMDSMTILLWLLCYMPILLYDYFVVDISVTCKYTSLIMSVWWSNRTDSFHCIPRGTPWMHFMDSMTILLWLLYYMHILLYDFFVITYIGRDGPFWMGGGDYDAPDSRERPWSIDSDRVVLEVMARRWIFINTRPWVMATWRTDDNYFTRRSDECTVTKALRAETPTDCKVRYRTHALTQWCFIVGPAPQTLEQH